MSTYRGAGVYAFRTRRPGLIGRLYWEVVLCQAVACAIGLWMFGAPPWWAAAILFLWPRHWAYVGETTAMELRRRQHLYGGGKFNDVAKPWADLEPTHYFLPLPNARKRMLRFVETLVMLLLWPTYNKKKNLWNPRRIPLNAARAQRRMRDHIGWCLNIRPIHYMIIIGGILLWLVR